MACICTHPTGRFGTAGRDRTATQLLISAALFAAVRDGQSLMIFCYSSLIRESASHARSHRAPPIVNDWLAWQGVIAYPVASPSAGASPRAPDQRAFAPFGNLTGVSPPATTQGAVAPLGTTTKEPSCPLETRLGFRPQRRPWAFAPLEPDQGGCPPLEPGPAPCWTERRQSPRRLPRHTNERCA